MTAALFSCAREPFVEQSINRAFLELRNKALIEP
jgi:hypothetical protein